MERAEFVFQIFFDTIKLANHVARQTLISFSVFSLPQIEIVKFSNQTGDFQISTGKRMNLKMPYVEVLEECPLYIYIKPCYSKNNVDRISGSISIKKLFIKSIQSPNTYLKKQYRVALKNQHQVLFGQISFSITLNYTSGAQIYQKPINRDTTVNVNSTKFQQTAKKKNQTNKSAQTFTKKRTSVIPEMKDSGRRSIFYFDKSDLKEENRVLQEEINTLTEHVHELRGIINEYISARTRPAPQQNISRKTRTDYIYQTYKPQRKEWKLRSSEDIHVSDDDFQSK